MNLATLFSGIGAPEQGASRVYDNVNTVFACEWDSFARQSYEANYNIDPIHFHKDVNDLDATKYKGKVDVLVGGSPCQAFSIAGKRKGFEDTRGTLFYEFARVINECKPKIFIYENVTGLISHDRHIFEFLIIKFKWKVSHGFSCVSPHAISMVKGVMDEKGKHLKNGYPSLINASVKDGIGKTFHIIEEIFIELGYKCQWQILNTKHYGIPQGRPRLYVVGFLDVETYHNFSFADKVPLELRLKDILEETVDDKYYLTQNTLKGFQSHSAKHLDRGNGFKFQPTNGGGVLRCA